MNTFHIDRELQTWRRGLGLFAVSLAVTSSALLAQEPEMRWVPEEKARIGVLLEDMCEAPPTTESACDRPPLVSSVVVDGPADAAGVQARDTLLSVNGLDVTRAEGRALLLGLEAGVPVELELGRDSGRTLIRVTPELRPGEPFVDVRTMFFGPPGELVEGPPDRVRVVRIPSVRARLDEVEVRLDSLRARGNDFVFFHKDSDGTFNVQVGDPETAHVILERLREHETASPGADLPEGADLPRYVWENEELARRLVRVRDSSFHSAQVHLDSLVRLRGHVQMLRADSLGVSVSVTSDADPGGAWTYYVTPRPVPGQLRTLLRSDLRVAGAEFRELSGGLAEYFDGAEEGLLVLRVLRDTPADRMGLRDGDVVVEVADAKCSNIAVLRQALTDAGPGGTIEVKWIRKGNTHMGNMEAH
jgi:hypothetical protein